MESQELINAFRKELDQVEAQGSQQVPVAALRAYLDALEQGASSSQEHRNREHAGVLARSAAINEQAIEMMKAVLEAGKSALNALLLINGGAVVALLGVMSNLVGKSGGDVLARHLALPLLLFGIGVLMGALCFGLRYLSQAFYSASDTQEDKRHLAADWLRNAAILMAIAGYGLFGLAVVKAYDAVIWSFAALHLSGG